MVALRRIRVLCGVIFVSGIAGLIISSIAGNNVGVVTTIGLITSLAAIVLLTASTIAANKRIDAFDDAAAEQLERNVDALIASGTNEASLRAIVRDAINLGRSASLHLPTPSLPTTSRKKLENDCLQFVNAYITTAHHRGMQKM